MSSTTVQDFTALHIAPYSFVEPAPFIPDPSYGVILRQRQATQLYSLTKEPTNTSSVVVEKSGMLTSLDKELILEDARSNLHSNIVDLDPDIRKLVNENIKNLIWK